MFRYFSGGGDIRSYIIRILLTLPIIALSLSLHESAHAYIANKLGDPTAKNLGRITLNPIKHLDIIGALCMLLFGFGWAKPVPIVTRNFKKPRRDMALSSIAGPISNILLAFIFVSLYALSTLIFSKASISSVQIQTVIGVWLVFLDLGATLNVYLAVFNLLPVPPLDGSRFFYIFLPTKWYFGVMKYERYISIGIFILLYIGVLSIPLSFLSNLILDGMFGLWNLLPIWN